ncbi:hypothetical protein ABAC460_22975 [Asticcacaulis sp. AC460]|nr:hypothetical protein ABAC460_22975 [Asticcacaulis sp. AC460]
MPFLTFVPVILLSAFWGRWPGAVCAVLAGGLAWRFLFPTETAFNFPWTSSGMALAVYALSAVLMVLLVDGVTRAFETSKKLEVSREELLQSLERRVEERTAELRAEIESRREAEAKVAQYERMEAVGQLVGGISHDFNNLLGIIIGNLDLAQRRLARGENQISHHIEAAFDGARRGASLTRRLLAFARKQPLQPVVVDVNGLVSGMGELLHATLGERIAVDLRLEAGLWTTKIDPVQFENALLNLAVNARDAMPDGGRLIIATWNEGDHVVVTVTDTGIGMSEAVLARAFEPFFTTKGVGQGTGLGLSQIHGYLKQSGGHADLESVPGEGTTVILYLPRHRGGPVEARAEVALSEARPSKRGSKVLVVEDEAGVRAIAVQVLIDLGFRVAEADGGAAALRLLADDPEIEVLFTDIIMPGMLGSELAKAAKVMRPELRVLYMTGYTYDAVTRDGVLDPGVELLSKPFTPDQLARKMDRVLA